jgi:type IV pilus assembly protein PilZ
MGETAQQNWADRRSAPRVVLKTAVTFSSESNFYTGFLDNISEGGLFIATYHPAQLGTMMQVEFSLPDDGEPISVEAEVRWVRETQSDSAVPPGIGLRFVNLPVAERDRIESFAKRRDTIFYDDDL